MSQTRNQALQTGAGLAAGAALAVVCPAAAALVGLATFLRDARRYAQSGKVEAAREMVTGYTETSCLSDSAGRVER